MGRTTKSSSMESSSSSSNNNLSSAADHLSTDLRLGLTNSTTTGDVTPTGSIRRNTQLVKVYMEGIPIGRKLDLLALHDYTHLIATLNHMFTTTILWADGDGMNSNKSHVLTYEDEEGDWLMVGDVPWEVFLTTVKRLKITRADN